MASPMFSLFFDRRAFFYSPFYKAIRRIMYLKENNLEEGIIHKKEEDIKDGFNELETEMIYISTFYFIKSRNIMIRRSSYYIASVSIPTKYIKNYLLPVTMFLQTFSIECLNSIEKTLITFSDKVSNIIIDVEEKDPALSFHTRLTLVTEPILYLIEKDYSFLPMVFLFELKTGEEFYAVTEAFNLVTHESKFFATKERIMDELPHNMHSNSKSFELLCDNTFYYNHCQNIWKDFEHDLSKNSYTKECIYKKINVIFKALCNYRSSDAVENEFL